MCIQSPPKQSVHWFLDSYLSEYGNTSRIQSIVTITLYNWISFAFKIRTPVTLHHNKIWTHDLAYLALIFCFALKSSDWAKPSNLTFYELEGITNLPPWFYSRLDLSQSSPSLTSKVLCWIQGWLTLHDVQPVATWKISLQVFASYSSKYGITSEIVMVAKSLV